MIKNILSLILLLLLSGCAWMMHGPKQIVEINSNPPSATVYIDYQVEGKTPLTTILLRDDMHVVKIELEGYEPIEFELIQETDGWFWANLAIGGVGMVMDYFSGSMYFLTPEQVNAELIRKNSSTTIEKNTLYIDVVMESKPEWEKVGTLVKN